MHIHLQMFCLQLSNKRKNPPEMLPRTAPVSKLIVYLFVLLCMAVQTEEQLERIRRLPAQWLLEAKIGHYKLFDKSFLSLILRNAWVADEVRKF